MRPRTASQNEALERRRQVEVADDQRRRPRPRPAVDDRRDRDRTGRPPRVAAAEADDQQVARVAQTRSPRRARTPRAGSAPYAPAPITPRDEHDARRARSAAASSVERDGRSPKTSHATTPTTRTCRLPSTVASPAPTYSIAWCQNVRSPAKKTPAMSREADRPSRQRPVSRAAPPGDERRASGSPNRAAEHGRRSTA